MNFLFRLSFVLLIVLSLSANVQAQKFGHFNTGLMLEAMPEVEAADKELASLRDNMIAKGEKMAKTWQDDYMALATQVNQGTISPADQQAKEEALTKRQQEIAAYEQEILQKIGVKREELLAPILQRLDAAIKAVGEENGYTMIFDSSVMNAILFLEESDDVMPLVKAKLGM